MFSADFYNRSYTHKKAFKYEWISSLAGFVFTALLPPLHIFCLWFFWQNYSRNVDKRTCTCSCWDTVFKGTYESGIASYKHFYFNATENTFKIWILVATFLIALHECVRWLVSLWLTGRLRYSMALLFFTSLFSHYYSWWIYINYYNDEFYSQWNHQLLFSVTELLSTCIVLRLASRERPVTLVPAVLVAGIAVFHVIAASRDQFLLNVLQGEGHAHQILMWLDKALYVREYYVDIKNEPCFHIYYIVSYINIYMVYILSLCCVFCMFYSDIRLKQNTGYRLSETLDLWCLTFYM